MTQPRTLRLFVAIELPAEVLERLTEAQHGLQRDAVLAQGLRWVRPEGIHLTLKFLGETPPARQKDIEGAIERGVQGVAPFRLALGRLGKFGSRTTPRVLWIDVGGDGEALLRLQYGVERELAQLGYPPENRAFAAHLTLARVREESARDVAGPLEEALANVKAPAGAFEVREVALMKSDIQRGGAVYTQLFAAALR